LSFTPPNWRPLNTTAKISVLIQTQYLIKIDPLEKKRFKVNLVTGGILEWVNASNKVEQTNKIR